MSAGLANRMFQYAYSLYLMEKGYDVFQDNNYKATTWEMEDIGWNRIFPEAVIRQSSDWDIFRCAGSYNLIDKVRRHYLPFLSKTWIGNPENIVFSMPHEEDIVKYNYFIGVFVNAKMVETVRKQVLNCFSFSSFEDESNMALANEILTCNSVAVHVRKGKDYLKNKLYHNVCSANYYRKAINYIESQVVQPKFYLFTDNPDWVKKNLDGLNFTLVDHNPSIGWGNHFDMQLMSLCKHNIIANSTYSWWGAYLNGNPNKIVVSPKFWFNPDIGNYNRDVENLFGSNWISVDVVEPLML